MTIFQDLIFEVIWFNISTVYVFLSSAACNINELDVPINGKIGKHLTHSGKGSATIACQTGYKINGNTAATCINSKWTKPSVTCHGMNAIKLRSLDWKSFKFLSFFK